MALRLDFESVRIRDQDWSTNGVSTVCIAINVARIVMWVSSHPAASIFIVMHMGICTTAKPSLA